jgi:hypothetical protein
MGLANGVLILEAPPGSPAAKVCIIIFIIII